MAKYSYLLPSLRLYFFISAFFLPLADLAERREEDEVWDVAVMEVVSEYRSLWSMSSNPVPTWHN